MRRVPLWIALSALALGCEVEEDVAVAEDAESIEQPRVDSGADEIDGGAAPEIDTGVEQVMCHAPEDCASITPPINCLGAWRCDPDEVIEGDFRGPGGCVYLCGDVGPVCAVDDDCLDRPAPIRCPGSWYCAADGETTPDHLAEDLCGYTCDEPDLSCAVDEDCGSGSYCVLEEGAERGVCAPLCDADLQCEGRDAPIWCEGAWSCGLVNERGEPDHADPDGCVYHCDDPIEMCVEDADCEGQDAPLRCLGAWSCDPTGEAPADHRGEDGCVYNCGVDPVDCQDDAECGDGMICLDGACAPDETLMCVDAQSCEGRPAPIRCLGAWSCDPTGEAPADHRDPDNCVYNCDEEPQECGPDAPCPEGMSCVDGACVDGPWVCGAHAECLDHNAPIRCVGVWRCDPQGRFEADDYGEDGCNYTCLGGLPPCRVDEDCANGDACAPCPTPDACAADNVCQPVEVTPACSPERLEICADLPHDECVGAWTCPEGACVWACEEVRPEIQMNACFGDQREGCCAHEECGDGFCQAAGYDAQNAYCGGMAPPEFNECVRDQCWADEDCGVGQACVLAGAHGYVLNACVRATCLEDSQCREGGACLPFFAPCNSYGFACAYPDDPCRVDADCPQDRWPMLCLPNQDGHGTRCVEDLPMP